MHSISCRHGCPIELSHLDERTQRVGSAALIASAPLAAFSLTLGSLNSSLTALGGPNYWYFTSRGGESLLDAMITISASLFTFGAVYRWRNGSELALAMGIGALVGGFALIVFLGLAYATTPRYPGIVVTELPNFPWGWLVAFWGLVALVMLPFADITCRRLAANSASQRSVHSS